MTRLVPVRDVLHLRLAFADEDRWIGELRWVPLNTTELHLASRYYPFAVRFDAGQPRLGIIVDQQCLSYPLRNAEGKWRGGYRPIALRCFPFQTAGLNGDPLSDLMIDASSPYLSETIGLPLALLNRPNDRLAEVHRLFHLLKRAEGAFAGVLDHFLIGDLLIPLNADGQQCDANEALHIVDPARFDQLKSATLGAMARHSFLSLDVATACLFSLQNLRAGLRPKVIQQSNKSSPVTSAVAPDLIVMNDLPLALDDGELVTPANVEIAPRACAAR